MHEMCVCARHARGRICCATGRQCWISSIRHVRICQRIGMHRYPRHGCVRALCRRCAGATRTSTGASVFNGGSPSTSPSNGAPWVLCSRHSRHSFPPLPPLPPVTASLLLPIPFVFWPAPASGSVHVSKILPQLLQTCQQCRKGPIIPLVPGSVLRDGLTVAIFAVLFISVVRDSCMRIYRVYMVVWMCVCVCVCVCVPLCCVHGYAHDCGMRFVMIQDHDCAVHRVLPCGVCCCVLLCLGVCLAVCWCVLVCVGVCWCVLPCAAVCYFVLLLCSCMLPCITVRCRVLLCVAVCCHVSICVSLCVAVCCFLLRCTAVCCRV
jgi:hypothetical protein